MQRGIGSKANLKWFIPFLEKASRPDRQAGPAPLRPGCWSLKQLIQGTKVIKANKITKLTTVILVIEVIKIPI